MTVEWSPATFAATNLERLIKSNCQFLGKFVPSLGCFIEKFNQHPVRKPLQFRLLSGCFPESSVQGVDGLRPA